MTLLFSGGNVVLRRCWWWVHQCRKNAIQQCQLLMIFGHCSIFFYFPASRLYLALVVVGTTVPKQRLFISANFWGLMAQLKVVLFFGGNGVLRRCWWLLLQCRYKGCSLVPIFDDYWHCWKCFLLRRQCCTSALLRVSTSVPKRTLFNKANFWEFFGTAYFFLFFGVKVVPGASGGWYYSAETKVVH